MEADHTVILSPVTATDPSVIPVNYPYLVEDVAVGDCIFLVDGLVEPRVEAKEGERIVCLVVLGGVILGRRF